MKTKQPNTREYHKAMSEMACWETEIHLKNCKKCKKKNGIKIKKFLPAILGGNQIEKDINQVIGLFREVNPSYERLYGNKTQRKVIERMIKKYTKEKVGRMVKVLVVSNEAPFAPSITTPLELEQKLAKLVIWYRRNEKTKPRVAKIK